EEIAGIGFDLWQVKAGTIFGNVLITDDPEHAQKVGEDVWRPMFEGEKKMKEALDEVERKKRDAEAAEAGAKKADDEDEDE
ncbi:hypothetical protein GN156_36610, partial [bacterium LRH843]|nr:hypothetical protein [bacterium LRH843]